MVSSVVFLQSTLCSRSTFWVIPFTCCGSQCCLAPKCFLLKNEHFGWFPSFFMVSSVVWFKYIFHSKSTFLGGSLHFLWFPVLFGSSFFFLLKTNIFFTFHGSLCCFIPSVVWVVPFIFYDFQCCLAPICFPLKINTLGGSPHFLWF